MKGCLLRFALLPLVVAILFVLLSLHAPFPSLVFELEEGGSVAAAIVGGILFWFAVLYLLDARRARHNLATAIEALGRGLRDGEPAVAYGTAEARGSLLQAPFSGEPCLGYHYVVDHYSYRSKNRQIDYEGCALAPLSIRGPVGAPAILAPAGKELFYEMPFQTLADEAALRRAESYLGATDFGVPTGRLSSVSRRETSDGPGSFRQDLRSGSPPDELRSCGLKQKVLRPGDEVHVAGIYSEAKQAIEPDPDDIMKPMHVVPGGEAALARKIRSKRRGAAVCAVLGLLVVAVQLLVSRVGAS